jgi:tetratricopeptide (TPR) repeat protein
MARGQRALDLPEGTPMLRAAFRDALASGDDRRATLVATDLGYELGVEQRREDDGRQWLEIALALSQRESGHPDAKIPVDNTMAILAVRAGRWDEAVRLFQEVVDATRARDPDDTNLGVALLNLGSAYAERRDFDDARTYMEQAAAHTERVLGPKHPSMTSLYANLALLSLLQGDFVEAEPALERALALQRTVLGDEHVETARTIGSLAIVQRNLGRPEASERLHRQALEIRRSKLGPDHPEVAESLRNLAWAVLDRGRPEEALELAEQAQAVAARRLAPDHPEHGTHAAMIAAILLEAGKPREALPHAEKAIELLDARGPGPNASLEARRSQGRALRDLRRLDASIEGLEQALATAEQHDASRSELALVRFELAQSLHAAGREPARARSLAEAAREGLRELSPGRRRDLERVEAWLAKAP